MGNRWPYQDGVKGTTHLWSIWCFLLVWGWAAPERVTAQWVQLVGADGPYLLSSHEMPLQVPLQLSEVSGADLNLTLVAVHQGNWYGAGLQTAFTVDLASEAERTSLHILADTSLKPGTYTLDIEFTTPESAAALLSVVVKRPSASLALVGSEQTIRYLHRKRSPWPQEGVFSVQETSGNASVRNLKGAGLGFADLANRSIAGGISIANEYHIQSGGAQPIPFVVSGELPLGKSKGLVGLQSPDVEGPLLIPFEIETRLAGWVLWVWLALGLGLGYAMRQVLAPSVALREARLQAHRLIRHLQEVKRQHPDTTFQEETASLLIEARVLLGNRKAKAIAEGIQRIEASLEKNTKELDERREQVLERFNAYTKDLAYNWILPSPVQGVVEAMQQQLGNVRKPIEEGRYTTAEAQLYEWTATLTTLQAPLQTWQTRQEHGIGSLKKVGTHFPVSIKTAWEEHVEALRGPTEDLKNNIKILTSRSPDKDGVQPVVDVLHAVQVVQGRIPQVGLNLYLLLNQEVTMLEQRALQDPQYRKLQAVWQRIEPVFDHLTTNPGSLLKLTLHLKLSELGDAIRQVQASARSQGDQYMRGQPRRGPMEAHSPSNLGDYETLVNHNTLTESVLPDQLVQQQAWMVLHLPAVRAFRVPKTPYEKDRTRLIIEKMILVILTVVLITGVGYALFFPNFVGTPDDLLKAFFWGWALDISLNTLTEVIPQMHKKA